MTASYTKRGGTYQRGTRAERLIGVRRAQPLYRGLRQQRWIETPQVIRVRASVEFVSVHHHHHEMAEGTGLRTWCTVPSRRERAKGGSRRCNRSRAVVCACLAAGPGRSRSDQNRRGCSPLVRQRRPAHRRNPLLCTALRWFLSSVSALSIKRSGGVD
jgi:hypothetical protein